MDGETRPREALPLRADTGHLLSHVIRFGRLLRLMGVHVQLNQMLELVRALAVISLADREVFYFAARAILITRHEDYPLFDQAFQLYWREPKPVAGEGQAKRSERERRARLPRAFDALLEEEEQKPEERTETRLSYSARETLRNKDFSAMSWEEIEAAKAAMLAMEWPISQRPTRRMRRATRGRQLDLRHVVRDNLRYGGEPISLRWRVRRQKQRPLVVLCDISGSMERYSRMLLHFLHAFSHRMGDVESFVFGTRLSRVTHYLRHRDVDDAMDEVGKVVQDWSGGTRIGDALKSFNFDWSRRVLGRGAIVLIISDGWDRGDAALLEREMTRLQRSTHRLIWLNPLLGSSSYEPVQRGMAAALPLVDDFLTVHNLNSLVQLANVLSTVGQGRPERRQRRVNLVGNGVKDE